MTRVVWAEESKNGLRFEIGPSCYDVQTRSQLQTDRQFSCIAKALEEEDQVKNEKSNAERNKLPSGEHLENTKTPSKTWDNGGSHSSTSHYNSEPKKSDILTTTSRQGEE